MISGIELWYSDVSSDSFVTLTLTGLSDNTKSSCVSDSATCSFIVQKCQTTEPSAFLQRLKTKLVQDSCYTCSVIILARNPAGSLSLDPLKTQEHQSFV